MERVVRTIDALPPTFLKIVLRARVAAEKALEESRLADDHAANARRIVEAAGADVREGPFMQATYIGQWGPNLPHGYGIRNDTGDTYVGQFRNGDFSGYGIYTFREAASTLHYRGRWWRDVKQGHGIITWKSGSVLAAQFSEHDIHGYAVLTRGDGVVYEGRYEDNVRWGQGVEWSPEGVPRFGRWEDQELVHAGVGGTITHPPHTRRAHSY